MKPYIDVASILAATLREVAARFDDPRASCELFEHGICFAVSKLWPQELEHCRDDTIYGYVDKLLGLVEGTWVEGESDYLIEDTDGKWDDRANMCLFMAEWVESELL